MSNLPTNPDGSKTIPITQPGQSQTNYAPPQNLPTYQPNQGGMFSAWNSTQQPTMKPGAPDWNTAMMQGRNAVAQGPGWIGETNGYYLNQPQNSNPGQYGRWNWLGQGGGQQQPPGGQQPPPGSQMPPPGGQTPPPSSTPPPTAPIYTTPQPQPQFPSWNGIPGAPGDPWISGMGSRMTGPTDAEYQAQLAWARSLQQGPTSGSPSVSY